MGTLNLVGGCVFFCFILGLPGLMWVTMWAPRLAISEAERMAAARCRLGGLLGWAVGTMAVVAGTVSGTVGEDLGWELPIAAWLLFTTVVGWRLPRSTNGDATL